MRRLIALTFLGLVLLGAVLVLWTLGRVGIEQEAHRLAGEARERRARALQAAGHELESELAALLRREDERPFYHWRHLYLPPDLVAKNPALVPSPLRAEPPDPLVELYFEARPQVIGCGSPAFLDGPLASAEAPNEFAERIRPRLVELGHRIPELATAWGPLEPLGAPSPAGSVERLDVYVCRQNAGIEPVLTAANELPEEQYAQGWQDYQDRAGQSGGRYVPRGKQAARGQQQQALAPEAPQAQQAVQGEVEVRRSPFRLVALEPRDAAGWPAWVLAVREVGLPPEVGVPAGQARWLQGFALHLPRLEAELLPRLIARVLPEAELPLTADGAERLGGALLPSAAAPPPVVLVEAGRVPPDAPSAALPAPFERVALVHTGPLPDPRQLLRGSRRLLDGALVLALLVVAAGGALLLRAALAERRLARQRSDFVAALTHELKAPLTGIRALSELLHEGVVTAEAQRREYYASILGESQRLSRLVQNVLDAARLERGAALQVSCGPVELGPLLEELVRGLRPPLAAVGVELQLEGTGELPPVLADREAVAQVLSNLLDNAAKYGRGARPLVSVSARASGPRVEVLVRDHGPGVGAEERERVFERFWRSPSAPREVGGAGLGLWIARAQARAMGGDLSLVPVEGAGACFRLELPLLAGEARA